MSNAKLCLKCGHKTHYQAAAPIACEACAAIYRKVEEALRAAPARDAEGAFRDSEAPRAKPAPRGKETQARPGRQTPLQEFVGIMRAESLYPTWRELVKWFTWLGYAVALSVFVMGIFAMRAESTWASISLFIGAVVLAVMTRISRELSLMVADLADASVWAAAGCVDTDLSFLSFLELYGTEIAERRMTARRVVEAFDVVEHV